MKAEVENALGMAVDEVTVSDFIERAAMGDLVVGGFVVLFGSRYGAGVWV
jgi:hypothetical protein